MMKLRRILARAGREPAQVAGAVALTAMAIAVLTVPRAALATQCPQVNACPDLSVEVTSCTHTSGTDTYTINFKIKNLDPLVQVTDQIQVEASIFQNNVEGCPTRFYAYDTYEDDIAGGQFINKSITINVHIVACRDVYFCCDITVDHNDAIDEDNEGNNHANRNIITGILITGQLTDISGPIANISQTTTVDIDNYVVNPPAGWYTEVIPTTSTVPAGEVATVTLRYLAPKGAQPTTIEVLSVEREGRFSQNNLFQLVAPTPVRQESWGRLKMLYR